MTTGAARRVLVAGGAGFLGSGIATRYAAAGWDVTVIDGLVERTGGRAQHLAGLGAGVRFLQERIENVPDLPTIVSAHDVVVDCMAWTSHRLAMQEPVRDLRLNAESHLHLIEALQVSAGPPVIYLGSRSQFGDGIGDEIGDDSPMIPRDVQGIHKLAGELYFRVYAKSRGRRAISLRVPNCFGPRQPVTGDDIGLVGSLIRDLLAGTTVEVFGDARRRGFAFAGDIADVVYRLGQVSPDGFLPLNFGGWSLTIEALVEQLVQVVGRGGYTRAPLPASLEHVDMGNAHMRSEGLQALLGEVPMTDLPSALAATVAYFRRALQVT
jgi:UDP-glucose 4-epimerase